MPTFILIGHCGADRHLLKNAINRAVPGSTIEFAADHATLRQHLDSAPILLINRVLDGGFETDSGVELISTLAKSEPKARMLLISNHDDAQQQAVAAGALPGFGKRDVNSPRTAELLRSAAG